MSRVSDRKKEKIKEEILRVLYDNSPVAISTSSIANEIIRDNEFILGLLKDMERVGLVRGIRQDRNIKKKKVRIRWRMSNKAFKQYQEILARFK